jgi:hypothetical protein
MSGPGRRLFQLNPEGGQFLGESGQQLRTDGLRRGHLGPPAHGKLRLPPGKLEKKKTLALFAALQGLM